MLRQLEGVTRSGMRLQEQGLSTALAGEVFVDAMPQWGGRRTVAILQGEVVAIILVVVWVEVLVVVVVVGGMIVVTATATATAGGCATCGGAAAATAAVAATILCQSATP